MKKENLLFVILGGFFITNALVAEFIGIKIFSLEQSFGFDPVDWKLFGEQGLSFNLTAGVLLWPIVFTMTDVINEYYGKKGVRLLSYLAVGMISYAFVMIFSAISLPPAGFWSGAYTEQGVPDMQVAYASVLGQGLWIIVGSMVAFLVGQLVDVYIFQYVRKFTGSSKIWLRALGSTLVSQFIDSYIVLYIAFVIGADWSMSLVFAIGTVNYIYKVIVAILLIPLLYLLHEVIDRYLGKDRARAMAEAAAKSSIA